MPCSSDYCISGTSLIYDDTYSVAGVYDSYDYFTGSTNGYYIFYSSGETRWCVAPNLGDPCELFGPSPITDTCPDLYPGIFNVGVCVTTSTTTSACLDFDFEAVFDCSISPTPTVTPTITPTPSLTPAITPTNACNVFANISAIKKPKTTPVPTQTPTPSTSQVVRPCSFSGTVQYNVVEGYIKCANSSKFENCFTGEFYFTTETIFDQNGQSLIQDYVYGGFIDNVSVCFIFRGFVDYISGPSNVIITNIYGSVNEGKCIDCNVIPSQTPTPTPTLTPTPTVSLGPACNQYEISNTSLLVQEYKYYDCKNKLISPSPLPSQTSILVCSISEPIVYSPSMVVTNLGSCPSPSQTPTPTPTLTPTQTPQAVYSWFSNLLGYASSGFACLVPNCDFQVYSDVSTLVIGDVIYTNNTLTTPFIGNGNWYRLNYNCNDTLIYAARINGSGNIIDIIEC